MKENKIIAYIVLAVIVLALLLTVWGVYRLLPKEQTPVVNEIVETVPEPSPFVPRELTIVYREDGAFYQYEGEQIPLKFSAGIEIETAETFDIAEGQQVQVATPYGVSDNRRYMLYSEGHYPDITTTTQYFVINLETQRRYGISLTNANDPRTQHEGSIGIIEQIRWVGNRVEVYYRVGAQRMTAVTTNESEPWNITIDLPDEVRKEIASTTEQ